MSNRGKINFCSTKTVWLLSSNPLLAMAFCFCFAELAFTNLHLSSSFFFMVDLDGRIVSTVTLSHLELLQLEKPKQQVRKVSHCGRKRNNRDHASQSFLLLLVRATYIYLLCFAHTPFVVNHTFNTTLLERLQHQF